MRAALEKLRPQCSFDIQFVDIDGNLALEQQFGELIPVLVKLPEERVICHYHLNESAFQAACQEIHVMSSAVETS